mmetsp:Transcript_1635/g.4533  ORF Transcript_1635/g.4533 Transcript_1635/m.4533 type:complete len:857 (-) Transcript_1635:1091-3661(-)
MIKSTKIEGEEQVRLTFSEVEELERLFAASSHIGALIKSKEKLKREPELKILEKGRARNVGIVTQGRFKKKRFTDVVSDDDVTGEGPSAHFMLVARALSRGDVDVDSALPEGFEPLSTRERASTDASLTTAFGDEDNRFLLTIEDLQAIADVAGPTTGEETQLEDWMHERLGRRDVFPNPYFRSRCYPAGDWRALALGADPVAAFFSATCGDLLEAEQFMIALAATASRPRVRAHTFRTLIEAPSAVLPLVKAARTICNATEELLGCDELARALEMLLAIGNTLNENSRSSKSTKGFYIRSLLPLIRTSTNPDPKPRLVTHRAPVADGLRYANNGHAQAEPAKKSTPKNILEYFASICSKRGYAKLLHFPAQLEHLAEATRAPAVPVLVSGIEEAHGAVDMGLEVAWELQEEIARDRAQLWNYQSEMERHTAAREVILMGHEDRRCAVDGVVTVPMSLRESLGEGAQLLFKIDDDDDAPGAFGLLSDKISPAETYPENAKLAPYYLRVNGRYPDGAKYAFTPNSDSGSGAGPKLSISEPSVIDAPGESEVEAPAVIAAVRRGAEVILLILGVNFKPLWEVLDSLSSGRPRARSSADLERESLGGFSFSVEELLQVRNEWHGKLLKALDFLENRLEFPAPFVMDDGTVKSDAEIRELQALCAICREAAGGDHERKDERSSSLRAAKPRKRGYTSHLGMMESMIQFYPRACEALGQTPAAPVDALAHLKRSIADKRQCLRKLEQLIKRAQSAFAMASSTVKAAEKAVQNLAEYFGDQTGANASPDSEFIFKTLHTLGMSVEAVQELSPTAPPPGSPRRRLSTPTSPMRTGVSSPLSTPRSPVKVTRNAVRMLATARSP